VLVFVPNIVLLFLAIGFLEDSGYMARAAFVMDRLMHRIGLHGKSFIPMLIGFGCSVPAIMATRSLDSQRDRLVTALILPFMSCSARLPVYTLLISAFFAPRLHSLVLLSLYLLGIVVAAVMAHVLGRLVFGREQSPLLMELPPYRMPTLHSIMLLMWQRTWQYIKKAGTILLAASILMWWLATHPQPSGSAAPADAHARLEASYAGRLGRLVAPALRPLGFDWRMSMALIAGFSAKEAVVSTLGVIHGVGTEDGTGALRARLAADTLVFRSPLDAYALMVFVLLYCPCLGVITVFVREFGARWAAFMVGYTTAIAWLAAFLVQCIGRLFS